MATTVMVLNRPTLKVSDTEAGIAAGLAVECQVNQARVECTPNYNTIPATGCSGATQSPGQDSWSLELIWLDDWTAAAAESLSRFAYENSGSQVWYELTPDTDVPTVKVTGSAYCASGGVGGTFGDGSAAQSTVTWPCIERPLVSEPAVTAAAA